MASLFTLEPSHEALRVKCFGAWDNANVSSVLQYSFKTPLQNVIFELSEINSIDTAGAMALLHVKKNPLAYVCSCSRKELQTPGFLCTCKTKNLPLIPRKSALKFDIQALEHEDLFGIDLSKLQNPVLWQKEDIPAYHLASLCDDSSKGACLLIRGDDLRESSALQLLLAKSLNLDGFIKSTFIHHPLIKTSSGQKLSKSRLAKPLDLSASPELLYMKASEILGLKPCFNAQSLLESFGKNEKSLGFGFKIGGEK